MRRLWLLSALIATMAFPATPVVVSINGNFIKASSSAQLWAPNFDLNEMQWNVFDSTALSNGAVSSFVDSVGGLTCTQATGAKQPTQTSGSGGLVFTGNDSLSCPTQSDSWRTNQSFILIAQADITHATNSSGTLIAVGGFTGSNGNRAPGIFYNKGSPNTITVQWGVGANSCSQTVTWPDDTNLHVIDAGRRATSATAMQAFISIDGGTEVTTGTNCIMIRDVVKQSTLIGDFQTASINWTLNYFSIQQETMTADMAQRANAWGMWRIGRQASMPGGNPWISTPPTSNPYVNPYNFTTAAVFNAVQTSAYWTAGIGTNPGLKVNYPNSMASLLVGKSAVWTVNFNTTEPGTQICSENAAAGGTCQFFGPTIDAAGGTQTNIDPAVNVPAVFSSNGTTATITMQPCSGASPPYCSGTISSVNLDGLGHTFNPCTAPTFIKVLASLSVGNGANVTWAAPLWLEPVYQFKNRTTPYEEADVPETYGGEVQSGVAGANDHQTQFLHPSLRAYGTRNTGLAGFINKDFILDSAHSWPGTPPPVSTYDGTIHEYDFYEDSSFSIGGLDMNELGRWITQAYRCNNDYLTITMNLLSTVGISGNYPMNIQSVTVYQ